MKVFILMAICIFTFISQASAQEGFPTKPDERAVNIGEKFITAWKKGNQSSAGKFASKVAVEQMFIVTPVDDEKIKFDSTKYLPGKKRWNYSYIFISSQNRVALQFIKTKIGFRIVAVKFYFQPIVISSTEDRLIDAIIAIGCKIKKDNGSILYDPKLKQWKKDEFKMRNQTVITASNGSLIYFEVEIYTNEVDAEFRLKNFKKVFPEIEAINKETDGKLHSELDFREAFRRDRTVYFFSVTTYQYLRQKDI